MTWGMVRHLVLEGSVPIKKPQTPEQKRAMLELVKWAGEKMGAGPEDIKLAFDKAKKDDWSEAMDLLSMYYVMKGIPFKGPASGQN